MIERDLHEVLDGFEMGNFLAKAGVKEAGELLYSEKFEEVAPGFARATAELLGVEGDLKVDYIDDENDENRVYWKPEEERFVVNRKAPEKATIGDLAYLLWHAREREIAKSGGVQGEKYRVNYENFLPLGDEMYDKQLVVKEKKTFANEMIQILYEQSEEEAIQDLPLPKRVWAKWQRRKQATMSKKYKMKRGK